MQKFGNYEILEKLYETKYTDIFRVTHNTDKSTKILKAIRSEFPSREILARLQAEFQILTKFESEYVIKSFSLEKEGHRLGIVLEDIQGISLKEYAKNKISLDEFYKIALSMVNAIQEVHKQNIIHKDINPSNFIYNSKTSTLKIIDFGISTNLPKEIVSMENPNILEGTLAYISPEQTGRMNRSIDYRSDFYSLGISFYELLTGKLPFNYLDPMELVHSHIAREPSPPSNLNPGIPKPLSDLVLKLIKKTAEKRYVSCYGIKYDLEMLQSGIKEYRDYFPSIASKDIFDKFHIPQKLYGREKEIQILLSAFDRVVNEKSEMLLITGYSGIGKSSVVAEVHRPITEKKGYFISGKFDQYNRNIPYQAFVNIFQNLLTQLLSESEEQLKKWKESILKALGANAQIIIDVIPEVEIIIGKQPPVPDLGVNESQNRFNIVFQKFIQIFTTREHPLVIFLDDLQWADGASLKLVHILMSSSSPGLLLIGAYRDNEVSSLHPLSITLNEISKTEAIVNFISLSPLDLQTVKLIISETLKSFNDDIDPLAELVFLKTGGNPFFMNEFLKSLYSENLLQFNYENQSWGWNIQTIRERDFTDNVVELMTNKIQKLPDETQELLRLAACIGNQFDLNTLTLVVEKNSVETSSHLFPAITENFIIPSKYIKPKDLNENEPDFTNSEYKFSHDRIQQAAYFLIPETERAKTHVQIGQILENQTKPDTIEENVFTIVNHLNFGFTFLESQNEKKKLANINLLAANKAMFTSAYHASIEYTKIGLILLGENSWTEEYEMTLKLHNIAVEVSWLLGEIKLMETWIDRIFKNAKNSLDQVPAYFVRIQALASQNKLAEAINTGTNILEKFGITFPSSPSPNDFINGINEITSLIGNREITELFHLPKMQDPEKLAVMNILACLIPTCYNAGSPLFPLIIIYQVNLSILFGNSLLSCFSYTNYGILLNNIMRDVLLSDKFRQLAIRLSLEPESKPMRAGTFIGSGIFLIHRTLHLRESIKILQEGYQTGMETGSLEFVGYGGYAICLNSFWCGENLYDLKSKIILYRESLQKLNQLTSANYCRIYLETVISLLEKNIDKKSESDENQIVREANASGDKTRLFYFYVHRMVSRYYLEEYTLALEDSIKVKEYLSAGGGTIGEIGFYFHYALLLLNKVSNFNKEQIESTTEWKEIEDCQSQIFFWAEHAPMNYLHKWNLIEAEKSKILGKRAEAQDNYDSAIQLSNQNGYLQDEAIANELYGMYWRSQDKKEFAQIYFQKAYSAYTAWGAKNKTELLEKKYINLNLKDLDKDYLGTGTIIAGTTTDKTTRLEANFSLDLFSILKASQIISSEIILEKLITSLMKILVENAGAESGFLLLYQNDKMYIETSWSANSNQFNKFSLTLDENVNIISPSIINYIQRTKSEIVLADATKEGKFQDNYIKTNKPKSILGIPLLNQSKLIGIIYLENNLTSGAFTKDRIEVLKMLSSQAAISIENARLYSNLENVTKEKTRVTTEMEIARDIQTSLLPKEPILTGFDVATYMHTADLVGGDYFDIIQTEGREWFLIGDVSGHGVSAGLIMMMTQTAIHTILNSLETKDPSILLSKVNKVITSNIQKMKLSKYMTLTLFLKEENGIIYYSGMHQDLLLYRANEKKVKIIETKGSWIGYYDLHNEYEVEHLIMEPDDVLLIFTDGITESMNHKDEMFEIEGLVHILNESGHGSAENIKTKILNSLKGYKTDDDITFMVCKRK